MKLSSRQKERLIREVLETLDESPSGHGAGARSVMARPTGHMEARYDDLDDDESTITGRDDLEEGDEEFKKQRNRKHNAIRGQLDNVWVSLGKAETKLGATQFEAEDVNFNQIHGILAKLIENVRSLMKKVEYARDHIE